MKFFILFALFVCYVSAATKEELEKKATDLETKLDAAIAKIKDSNPNEAKILAGEKAQLKVIADELTKATLGPLVALLEFRLGNLEKAVEARLAKIEGTTDGPTTQKVLTTAAPATTKKAY